MNKANFNEKDEIEYVTKFDSVITKNGNGATARALKKYIGYKCIIIVLVQE